MLAEGASRVRSRHTAWLCDEPGGLELFSNDVFCGDKLHGLIGNDSLEFVYFVLHGAHPTHVVRLHGPKLLTPLVDRVRADVVPARNFRRRMPGLQL